MQDNHKPNHRCLACGIEYWACDNCDKKISKTWRAACCTEEHYKAYYAMWQYGQGLISKEEAREVLAPQDALSWEKAPGRALIEEIMGEPEPETPAEEPEQAEEPEAPKAVQGKNKKRRR